MQRSSNLGFSILELLLVLGVIATLFAVGGLALAGPLRQHRAEETFKAYAANLRQISNDARSQSRQLFVDEDELQNGHLIWYTGSQEVGRFDLPEGASISNISKQFSSEPLFFSGRGLPSQQVSFTLTRFDKSKTLVLLPTGLVVSP